MTTLARFLRNERGATAVEYGLIGTLIAVAIIGAAGLVGTNLNTLFQELADYMG
jgi:pilus assembly protein Flp/PilA